MSALTGLIILAALVALAVRYGSRISTACIAASTVRRVSAWHAENDRRAEEGERERDAWLAWMRAAMSGEESR